MHRLFRGFLTTLHDTFFTARSPHAKLYRFALASTVIFGTGITFGAAPQANFIEFPSTSRTEDKLGSVPKYIAVFLDTESQNKLKAYFGSKNAFVSADHVILKLDPNENDMKKIEHKLGNEIHLKAVAYGEDEHCQSVLVQFLDEGILSEDDFPHITITAEDFSDLDSQYSQKYASLMWRRFHGQKVLKSCTAAWEGVLPSSKVSSNVDKTYAPTSARYLNLCSGAESLRDLHKQALQGQLKLAEQLEKRRALKHKKDMRILEERKARHRAMVDAQRREAMGALRHEKPPSNGTGQVFLDTNISQGGKDFVMQEEPLPFEDDGLLLRGILCTRKAFDPEKPSCRYNEPACSFCTFMKAGPCGQLFEQWEDCIAASKQQKIDFMDVCGGPTSRMKQCVDDQQYYVDMRSK